MDKGIYTALSGGLAKSHELEIVANNIANSNTPGFKADRPTFNEYLTELRRQDSVEGVAREIKAATLLEGRPVGDKSFVEMDQVYTDFSQGGLQRTHRTLDMAMDGSGFFEVLTPNGVRYTRQGNFSMNNDGALVTIQGYPVLSRYKEIREGASLYEISNAKKYNPTATAQNWQTPPGTANVEIPPNLRTIRLTPGVRPTISEDGSIYLDQKKVAHINVEEFKETQWLEKVGNGYFRNNMANNTKDGILTTKVLQGFIETSNVNPVREMTKLIEVTRQYESHMQAIKTYQEIDGKTVNDIAGGRSW